MSGFERMFSYEYVQGYTAALQDVLRVFQYTELDMKQHKRKNTRKNFMAIVECMIRNRAILREEPDAFVRCNDKVEGGYEVYVKNQGVYNPDTRSIIEGSKGVWHKVDRTYKDYYADYNKEK